MSGSPTSGSPTSGPGGTAPASGASAAPVALVTGASRGIGRCAALALADSGFDLVVTARRLEGTPHDDPALAELSTLASTADEIARRGRRVLPVTMDLLDRGSVESLAAAAVSFGGRLDVVVNNAIYQGRGPMERILDLDVADAETVMRADYLHQLLLIQRLVPAMLDAGGGTVVNLSSGSAHLDPPAPAGLGGWGVAYAAAKAAFTRIVPVLHAEFAASGLRTFNVDPGFVANERMVATGGDEQFTAAGFRGAPPEVPGAVIAWLCTSPDADAAAGTMVFAQRVCKDRNLVPGWPPPRASR